MRRKRERGEKEGGEEKRGKRKGEGEEPLFSSCTNLPSPRHTHNPPRLHTSRSLLLSAHKPLRRPRRNHSLSRQKTREAFLHKEEHKCSNTNTEFTFYGGSQDTKSTHLRNNSCIVACERNNIPGEWRFHPFCRRSDSRSFLLSSSILGISFS